jgi:hypothetical protein
MKKLLAFFCLFLCLFFVLSSCGTKEEAPSQTPTAQQTPTQPTTKVQPANFTVKIEFCGS